MRPLTIIINNKHKINILQDNMMQGKKRIVTFISLGLLLAAAEAFVVNQPRRDFRTRDATKSKLTLLELSSYSGDNPKPKTNIVSKIANTVSGWIHPWPFNKIKHKKEEAVDSEVIFATPKQGGSITKRDTTSIQPFPWPFGAIERSMQQTVARGLSKEQKLAKPLLKDAQRLIKKDKDLVAVLGVPVEFIPIVSTSTSSSKINGKKSVVIEDCFEIVGSKKSGRADLIADAHKKGHIRHLRVDVGGIHYDVDVE